MWTKEELSALQRRELQALAKEHGIQANSKSTEIIDELLAWADANALHVEIPTAEEEAGDAPSDAEGSGAENDESQVLCPLLNLSNPRIALSGNKNCDQATRPALTCCAASPSLSSPHRQ